MFLNNTFLYQCNSFFLYLLNLFLYLFLYLSTEVLNLFKSKILRTRLLSNNRSDPNSSIYQSDAWWFRSRRRQASKWNWSSKFKGLYNIAAYEAGGFHRGKERKREREREEGRRREKIENVAGHGLVGRVWTMIVVSLETEWRPSFPETYGSAVSRSVCPCEGETILLIETYGSFRSTRINRHS